MYTDRATAVKLFDHPDRYLRERDVYLLLGAKAITEILGHRVPELIRHDDELLAIEMEIVEPPYILDFASAYPEDQVPDFPPEVWEEWESERAEQFGARWPQVQRLLDEFRRLLGVVLTDVNPGNITFADSADR